MKLDEYMRLVYFTVVLEDMDTDGRCCFLAKNPQLPGCMSHGDTPDEAIGNLEDARRLYIESLLEDNLAVPVPVSIPSRISYSPTFSLSSDSISYSLTSSSSSDVTSDIPTYSVSKTEKSLGTMRAA